VAQDPRKSNFSLQKSSSESRRFPTIAITTPAAGSDDPEDIETSLNPEASQKLQKLSLAGLNPLKPLIIANTEFVPVGDGTNPDSTGLKVQLGDNNLLSVNSITKLFEIHRQVRLATISAADILLDRIKGFNAEKVLNILRKKIDESLEDLVKESLSQTVDAVIESIVAGNDRKGGLHQFKTSSKNAATKSNKAQASRSNKKRTKGPDANSESITPGAIKNISVSPKLGLDFSPIKRVFSANKEDPYLRVLVERVILEKITYDILKYMSGILSMKDAALARWSIYEALDFNRSEKDFDDNNISKMQDLMFGVHPDLSLGAAYSSLNDMSEVLKTYSGIKFSSNAPDVSLLIQFFIAAGESFLRQEEIMTEVLSETIDEGVTVKKFPAYRSQPNTKKALTILSNAKLSGIYTNTAARDDDYFAENRHKADERSFNASAIENIYNAYPTNVSKIDIHGDLLAASIFNDCIDIASTSTSRTKKIKAFYSLGQGIPGGISSVEDYYRELLEFDKDAARSDLTYKYNLTRSRPASPRLIKYLSAKSSNSDDLSDYIPFESTTLLGSIHQASYLTGPEYFYDVSLQRGDEKLTDLKSFAEDYVNFTSSYVSDIYEMTKLDYALPAAKKLLFKIGEELSTASENGSMDIFLLALMSHSGGDTAGLIRLFRSIYNAARLDTVEDKEGGGVGDASASTNDVLVAGALAGPVGAAAVSNQDGESFDPVISQSGTRRVMRVANQTLVKKFLYDAGRLTRGDINLAQSRAVLNYNGDQMPSAIQTNRYTSNDNKFNKISNGRTVVPGTEEENSNRIKYKIYRQSGTEYGSPRNGLNKELRALEGGPNISFRSSTPCPTFKYFLHNEHFEDAGLVSESQRISFNNKRQDKGNKTYHEITGLKYQGSGISLASHQRLFLLYGFIAGIINKSARVYVKSFEGGDRGARIEIWMSKSEIDGIAHAFKAAGSDGRRDLGDNPPSDKIIAYQNTRAHLVNFLQALKRRISKSAAAVLGPAYHGQQIYNQYVQSSKFIRQGDGSNRSKLGVKILKNRKIKAFHNSLDLLTDEGVAQIYKAYTTTLISAGKSSYTQEDVPSLNQIKLMMKILTTSGYGFLSSEKRGPKNICHIGVTNSMLNTLRYEAFKDFDDRRFLESRKFCVNIFKRNEVDSQILVYPRTYLFDSSLMIIDNNYLGESLNHITNFSDTWTFDQIIDNIEFTQWVRKNLGDDPFANLTSAFEPVFKKGSDLTSLVGKDVLINHVFDYAFKVYYRYALGLDLNENSFTLSPIRKNSGEVTGGISSSKEDIQADYNNLLNQTRLLYPAANVDQKLASELFRIVEIIAANPAYCLVDKVKKIIYPKKFDKVLSILVNEKDFVLYSDAYDKDFTDVYKTEPNFSHTSRIYRPEVKRGILRKDKNINKYIAECDEDFPEVFSMYATITILPE